MTETKLCAGCNIEFPYTKEYFAVTDRRRPSKCRPCENRARLKRAHQIRESRKEFNHDGPWGWLWGAIQEMNNCDKSFVNDSSARCWP